MGDALEVDVLSECNFGGKDGEADAFDRSLSFLITPTLSIATVFVDKTNQPSAVF